MALLTYNATGTYYRYPESILHVDLTKTSFKQWPRFSPEFSEKAVDVVGFGRFWSVTYFTLISTYLTYLWSSREQQKQEAKGDGDSLELEDNKQEEG